MREMRLSDFGISVRAEVGTQRTTCPHCSHLRKKKRDPCLSVTFKPDGMVPWCENLSGGWHDAAVYWLPAGEAR